MSEFLDSPLQFATACATLLAILWGIRKGVADVAATRAATRQTTNDVDRDVREEDREQATREVEANSALVASITAGWQVIAEKQEKTIVRLEERVANLEAAMDTREQMHERELEIRDNRIREYRTKLHAANHELAKHGMAKFLVEAGAFTSMDEIEQVAPERRADAPRTVMIVPVEDDPSA